MQSTYSEHYKNPINLIAKDIDQPPLQRVDTDEALARALQESENEALQRQLNDDEVIAKHLHDEQVDELLHDQLDPDLQVVEGDSRDAHLATCLSILQPVQVQPGVNSGRHLPQQEISKDRERLLTRLDHYGLTEKIVKGDGNCQFRALADQLYRSPMYWREVRNGVVSQLIKHPNWYKEYVPDSYQDYCASMKLPGTWGDNVTLQAAADLYGLHIKVLTSFAESPVISVEPREQRSTRVLWLSFWAEVHYNSLYPGGEPPAEPQHEKLLGSRRLARLVHEGEWPSY